MQTPKMYGSHVPILPPISSQAYIRTPIIVTYVLTAMGCAAAFQKNHPTSAWQTCLMARADAFLNHALQSWQHAAVKNTIRHGNGHAYRLNYDTEVKQCRAGRMNLSDLHGARAVLADVQMSQC